MEQIKNKVVNRFYSALDKDVACDLSKKQKESIERAINYAVLRSNNKVDVRKGLTFFNKRFFLVFILGIDKKKQFKSDNLLLLFGSSILLLSVIAGLFISTLIILYLIKSSMGIDLFSHFSFGVWDAFKNAFLS